MVGQNIENKKRWMKRYKRNQSCVHRLEERLKTIEADLSSAKSPKYSDMPKVNSGKTQEDKVIEKMELEDRIEALRIRSKIYRREILGEIDRLEDARLCEILESFFIDDRSFDEIAESMGYNLKYVIRLYSRAMDMLSKM